MLPLVSYSMRTFLEHSRKTITQGPPLTPALVTMVATLGTFTTALILERWAHQNVSVVILSVVLALSLSRQKRPSGRHHRLLDVVGLPMVGLGMDELGQLLFQHPNIGAVALTVAFTASMWLRQFRSNVARAGQLLMLPLTSILIVPTLGFGTGPSSRWWLMVAALMALAWVRAVSALAQRLRIRAPDPPQARPQSGPQPTGTRRGLSGHTRMAIQLAVALTASFIIGRTLFPTHWNWTVLTAVIVCGGGPARGEVMVKGASRLTGAAIGTCAAALVSSSLPGHHPSDVVLMFVLLFLGAWWREVYYAVWAGCVTCVIALLNDYLGMSGVSLLPIRLLAIAIGAACAITACCVILPTSTSAMVRRQRAMVMQSLSDVVNAIRSADPDIDRHTHNLDSQVVALRSAARPLRLQQSLVGRFRPPDPLLVHTVATVIDCAEPAHQALAHAAAIRHSDLEHSKADLTTSAAVVAHNVIRARRHLAGRVMEDPDDGESVVNDPALHQLNRAVLALLQPDSGGQGAQHVAQVNDGAAD